MSRRWRDAGSSRRAIIVHEFIGIPVAWVIAVGTGLWLIYRIVRGWLLLRDRRPAPLATVSA